MSDISSKEIDITFLGGKKENFEIIQFLGGKNINKYYKAYNKKEKRISCLKVIAKKALEKGDYDYLLKQIENEEKILKVCKCDNIVNIYDKFENENYIIFELEFCEQNLVCYFRYNGPLKKNLELFYDILLGVSKALKKLNDKGVMHRNIKTSNIFFKNKIIKLGGFDCAIYIKDNNFEPIGSLYYTAPEIIKNLKYDEKCDLWSLGITLYEILIGYLPYGKSINPTLLKEIILYEDNFCYKKSGFNKIDFLLNQLLTINKKNRINHKKYFDYVLYKKDILLEIKKKLLNYYRSTSDLIFENVVVIDDNKFLENYRTKDFAIKKIMNILTEEHLPDIMSFLNTSKCNNIIYYDENIDFINSINKDSDIFENNTPGSFILCTNLNSLELIKYEIIKQFTNDKRIYFNLITTGSKCEKVMEFINKDKYFADCIKNTCIYCKNVEKYDYLKLKFTNIHNDIYSKRKEVINFINNCSNSQIKPFPLTKLITYKNYIETYEDRHYEIAKYYGNLNPVIFEKSYNKFLNLFSEEKKDKIDIGLSSFRNKEDKIEDEDIIELDRLIIKEYTKNTFYGDLNKWLLNSKKEFYEPVAYFTARLMYSLNSFAIKQNKFFKDNKRILYRGIKLPYSSLLPYERAKGKIILFSSFTSSSELITIAEKFSSRKDSQELYKTNLKFSVIFYINNILKNENLISNGIDIQDESRYKKEKEILYQPFSFYYVNNVFIDYEKYTADIYLETIGKTCIFEEEMKTGKSIIYNEKEKILEINDKI